MGIFNLSLVVVFPFSLVFSAPKRDKKKGRESAQKKEKETNSRKEREEKQEMDTARTHREGEGVENY